MRGIDSTPRMYSSRRDFWPDFSAHEWVQRISCSSNLDFIIIINPNSGPGSAPWWPNIDYIREIPKLNAYPNVQVIGYVRTTWCKRPLEDVFTDIDTWSKRSITQECVIHGIFFDETPNLYDVEVKDYLDAITRHVKGKDEIHRDKLVSQRQ